MKISKRSSVMFFLFVFVALGIAATTKPDEDYKNLKILRKDISHDDLHKVMHEFNDGLGVKCNFCHAPSKEDSTKTDYASDEKPEKAIARQMMKMTNKINKKFFHAKSKIGDVDALLAVNCATCHHGSPHPEFEKKEETNK